MRYAPDVARAARCITPLPVRAPAPRPDWERISWDPERCDGRPAVNGTRVCVCQILEQLAVGASVDDVLRARPELERADVLAALGYAARLLRVLS